MNIYKIIAATALIVSSYFFFDSFKKEGGEDPVSVVVDLKPLFPKTQRLGVDLGTRNYWGSSQLCTNVLLNPGFEATINRILVIVSRTDKISFSDDKGWGHPDGEWKDAEYEVLSGPSIGKKGKISNSLQEGEEGLPQYMPLGEMPQLDLKNVVALTKVINPSPVSCWWVPDESKVSVAPGVFRDGSPGSQSICLSPDKDSASIDFYLDTITDRAGILLPVQGPWRLSFWMKADSDKGKLFLFFGRLGRESPFLMEWITPSTDWKEYTFDFVGSKEDVLGPLKLEFSASGKDTQFWLDDAFLGPSQVMSDFPFRQEVVSLLHELRPSYIRENQMQLGDQFPNRILEPFARKPSVFRGPTPSASYCYSIPELFQLCDVTRALPWLILPPILTDEELQGLGAFLLQNAKKERFSEVILEFGNENWNWLFRPCQIPYPEACAPVAEHAFQTLSAIVGDAVNLKKVMNAQFAVPHTVLFASLTPISDALGIATYFFSDQKRNASEKENMKALFDDPEALSLMDAFVAKTQEMKKKLMVYETNLGTIGGAATDEERLLTVTGKVAGAALAKRLIIAMYKNISPQSLYCFSSFDEPTEKGGKVRLFGITRDLGLTKRLRPTGLAMKMLNRILGGALHQVNIEKEKDLFTIAAFSTKSRWNAAIVSQKETDQEIILIFPEDEKELPSVVLTLESPTPFDTNEDNEEVKIISHPVVSEGRSVRVRVPAFSLVVM